jgi:hypothetical protein
MMAAFRTNTPTCEHGSAHGTHLCSWGGEFSGGDDENLIFVAGQALACSTSIQLGVFA